MGFGLCLQAFAFKLLPSNSCLPAFAFKSLLSGLFFEESLAGL